MRGTEHRDHTLTTSPNLGQPRRRAPWVCLVPVLIAAVAGAVPLRAQKSKPTDYDVKAAYLYNFGKFVEWPEKTAGEDGDSFAICVLGRDPFGPALDTTLMGQSIGGKKAIARRIAKVEDAAGCRILFISASEEDRLTNVMAALGHMVVLTVSDIPQFSQRGGMIQFVSAENRVRFEVNLSNTASVNLTLSSELLKVATAVRKNESGD